MELNPVTVVVHGIGITPPILVSAHKSRILVSHLKGVGRLRIVPEAEPAAGRGNDIRSVDLKGPLHNVDKVDSPVGHEPAGVVPEIAECGPAVAHAEAV